MKVWMSFDMEGVAGIVDWAQCSPGDTAAYALGCALLQDEVNAAIEGAIEGGATEIVLNDSHSRMANLDPRKIAGNAQYISGRHKPYYMMQGLDESFDAIFFIGYHGSISGKPSNMSHTYNPEVFSGAKVNGRYVGESGINALVADHYQVPIAFVSGDRITAEETRPFAAGAVNVITKESISRFSAKSLHPTESCRLIRAGAEEAVRKVAAGKMPLPQISLPTALDLEMQTADMADVATWAKGVERTGDRSVQIQNENLLEMFKSFVAVSYITRQAGGR